MSKGGGGDGGAGKTGGGERRGGMLARREGDIKGEDEGYQSPEKPRGHSLSADCIADASAVLNREILRSNLSPS